ncbi:MAG: hypothetical protein CVV64_11115 [Candidatus Wallbacteria bacterium HGW-Wallbacteria-1]|jgi:apolipoprotein N-acyltransferase|uniref:Apolipoprotein N-acyltransferase n=1 Tax=Candidatus Wallbacteria bacterium HGW-Wallbacteria-1 TaxID=2013854 RepID=A0A2N1PNY8_9BACT|nr:MAG: hypothetical protein CVV64_11115 [Candidatus Wallbacteria bacterium HGW-Wallbacteria-1]
MTDRNFFAVCVLAALISAFMLGMVFRDEIPLFFTLLGGIPIGLVSIYTWNMGKTLRRNILRTILFVLVFGITTTLTGLSFLIMVWDVPRALLVAMIPGLTLSVRLFSAILLSSFAVPVFRPLLWASGWAMADWFFLMHFPVMPYGVMGYLPARTDIGLASIHAIGLSGLSFVTALAWISLSGLTMVLIAKGRQPASAPRDTANPVAVGRGPFRASEFCSYLLFLIAAFLIPFIAGLNGGCGSALSVHSVWSAEAGFPSSGVSSSGDDIYVNRNLSQKEISAGIAAIQPAIEQDLKNSSGNRFNLLALNLEISSRAITGLREKAGIPDLPVTLIWPETSTPDLLRLDGPSLEAVSAFAAKQAVTIILGTRDSSRDSETGERIFFNSAVLFDSTGNWSSTYDKIIPATFAETGPYSGILSFLNALRVIDHRVVSGNGVVTFSIPTNGKTLVGGPMICYESLFPLHSFDLAAAGSNILFCLSNDAWFTSTAMPFHMLDESRIRSAETSLPMVRSSNIGISFISDSGGRIMGKLDFGKRGYVAGFIGKDRRAGAGGEQ